jgi:O-antigen ligase
VIVAGSIVGLAVVEGGIGLVQTLTGTGASIGEQHIRAVGTFGAYNIMELATVTGIALVICLAVAVTRKGRLRWMALAGTLFLSLAHLASLSRGAWVATSVAAIVVLSRGRPLRLLATVATVLILAGVVLPPLAQSNSEVGRRVGSLLSAESTPDQSLTDRLALWSAAERMALDHPLTGVGPRAFADHRDAYADLSLLGSSDISFQSDVDFQQVALKSPHNLYLLLASEQGLVVLLVYCIVVVVLLVRGLMRAARRRSDASTSLALIGVGLLVYELVSTVTGDLGGPGSILWGVVIGLAGWAAADVDLAPRLAPDLEVLALPGAAVRPSAAPASRSVSSPPPTPEPAVAADAGELTREGAS